MGVENGNELIFISAIIQLDLRSIKVYGANMGNRNWWTSFRWDERLSLDDALDLIKHILENGRIVYSGHLRDRMNERSFTMQDITCAMETGTVIEQEFDEENRNWKYKIEGKTIENDTAVVVSAVIERNKILIITVF